VSHHRKYNTVIGRPGPTAYSKNISSLTETLKLFITGDILNDIHTHRVMTIMGVTCNQLASPTTVKKGGKTVWKGAICPTAKDRKTD
jgi:hypothetical protein